MSWIINTSDLLYYIHLHVPRFPKKMLWVMDIRKRIRDSLQIYKKKWRVIPLICITPPHVVPVPTKYLDYRVKVRGNCSLCWYKSKCWPPLFTLFRSRNFPFFLISMRTCIYTCMASRYQDFEILIDNAQTQYMFYMRSTYKTNLT